MLSKLFSWGKKPENPPPAVGNPKTKTQTTPESAQKPQPSQPQPQNPKALEQVPSKPPAPAPKPSQPPPLQPVPISPATSTKPQPIRSIMLDLFFSCTNLPNVDAVSASDPYIVVELITKGEKMLLGRTEAIGNNLNPLFQKFIQVEYFPDFGQEIIATCYDTDIKQDDAIGSARIPLASIVSAGKPYTVPLSNNGKAAGEITVALEKSPAAHKFLTLKMECVKVKNVEVMSKSDPFLRVLRCPSYCNPSTDPNTVKPQDWSIVYESEQVLDNLNPQFKEFSVNNGQLCRSNYDNPIRLEIWDYSERGEHKVIGCAYTTLNRLFRGEKKIDTKDEKGEFTGTIVVTKLNELNLYNINDYFEAGMTLKLSIGVDFSIPATQKDKKLSQDRMKQYQTVFDTVGPMLMKYDSDKSLSAYGFGAVYQQSDCFNLTLSQYTQEVRSINSLYETYADAADFVVSNNAPNFAQVIRKVRYEAEVSLEEDPWTYHVLLIFCNGTVNDKKATIDEIVACSPLPMSIIIVSVSSTPSPDLVELDADRQKLISSTGKVGIRDCVQYVKYSDFEENYALLNDAIMKELPTQINIFYDSKGIYPR